MKQEDIFRSSSALSLLIERLSMTTEHGARPVNNTAYIKDCSIYLRGGIYFIQFPLPKKCAAGGQEITGNYHGNTDDHCNSVDNTNRINNNTIINMSVSY